MTLTDAERNAHDDPTRCTLCTLCAGYRGPSDVPVGTVPIPAWQYEAFRRWYAGNPEADPDPAVGRATRPPGG